MNVDYSSSHLIFRRFQLVPETSESLRLCASTAFDTSIKQRNVHVEPRCRLGRDFAGRQLQKFSTGARQGRPFAFCTSSNFIAHSLTHPHGCNRMIVAAFTYAQMLHFLLSLAIGRCRHSSGRRRHCEVVVVVALVFYRHGLRPKATRTRFWFFALLGGHKREICQDTRGHCTADALGPRT